VATFFAATLGFLLAGRVTVRASESTEKVRRISVDEVRQVVIGELRSRAIAEEQFPPLEDIELPLAVPMRAGSTLRVFSVCWDRDAQRARFQLQCAHVGDCLPFLAYVRTASRGNAPSCRLESVPHTARSSSASGVRAGTRATALLSRAGIRINAAVICLQGGDPGDIIRVRGEEGNIFRARIIGPSLVEASFE